MNKISNLKSPQVEESSEMKRFKLGCFIFAIYFCAVMAGVCIWGIFNETGKYLEASELQNLQVAQKALNDVIGLAVTTAVFLGLTGLFIWLTVRYLRKTKRTP